MHGGPTSRSELVARTGLTRSAIRGLVGELAAAGLVAEERAASAGHAGPAVARRPARSRCGAVVLASRSRSIRWPRPLVGLGGRIARARPRRSPAPATPRSRRVVADLAALADDLRARRCRRRHRRRRRGGRRASSGGATASCPWPRTSAGRTSRSAERLAGALGIDGPGLGRQRRRPRRARRAPPRRGVGVDDLLYISGEVGVGGGADRRRPAADRGGRLRRRGRPHAGQPGRLACRCGSVGCWETEVGEGALLAPRGPPARRRTARRRCRAARRRGRVARSRSPRSTTSAAGSGSGSRASSTS